MAQISKKLQGKLSLWVGRFRQELAKVKKSLHIPKTVEDVKPLVAEGYDPLHSVYIAVQNITSVFAECVSGLPELKSYYKTIEAAEDEYLPQGPPMSPLTGSYFTTWAFFDFRFGRDHETIGTCLVDVAGQLGFDPSMTEAIRQYQLSRMGIYEHTGTAGRRIRLEELHDLLKYGPWTHHWNEFVFQGFHHAQSDAIFLTGIPDIRESLPHAKRGRR